MKTLLIPVDANTTDLALINFAAAWVTQYKYERVVLLQSLYENVFSTMAMSADYVAVNPDNISDWREDVMWKLNDLAQALQKTLGESIEVKMAWSEQPLLRAIMWSVKEDNPQLILLQNKNSDDPISASLIAIARTSPVRLLVVPAGMAYQPVTKALIPVDFKAFKTLDKMQAFQQSPLWVPDELIVLNVDPQQHYLQPSPEFRTAVETVKSYLQQYNYEIEYSNNANIISAILDYADHQQVSLIVALPGKHSFLYSLTHKSISEGIYKAAKLPVMILK
ncbi:hypothetical protein SAMN05444266_10495 [Chitinophaga jiangningensis]|uniref:Universal stress protein family protein n=1 Tax=Chitinophaga jiangningensis TaxID=1419482 RepID=A0A1M7BVR6_9BACT|nr:hypothetical protein [Chitinophaga jiangningensis]SHL59090.1 hypothetical protein SAMN05444266_10495 [Chitinophaga jiangningensis]